MTDKEKKAIERINRMLIIESTTKNIGTRVYISDLEAVLNLLQKQQKEIEYLTAQANNLVDEYEEIIIEKNNKLCILELREKEMQKENSIPVSLVEEKIDEYTNLLKSCNRFSDVDRIKAINERILILKELLESEE